MGRGKVLARIATATAVVVVTSLPSVGAHATSPLGDVAAAWPSSWTTYTYADSTPVLDPTGDVHPNAVDLSSGTGTSPTVYYAADGTTLFLRLRLAGDPSDASKGGLAGDAYVVRITTGGTVVALAGANGKSPSADYVFVASGDASVVTPVYVYPFTTTAAALRVVPDGSGQLFLDMQVPIARITTASGGAVTGSTSVGLAVGTTSSANLSHLGKDVLTGTFAEVPLGAAPAVDPDPMVVPDATPDPVVPTPETPTPSVVDTPSPVVETPTPETSTPVVETPTPPVETTVVETPTPPVETTVVETPNPPVETTVVETPTPAVETTVAETPAAETPTPEVPVEDVPVEDVPSPEADVPPVVPTPEEPTPETPTPGATAAGPIVVGPVVGPVVAPTAAQSPAARLGTEVRDLRVVRGSVQRNVPELPFTGMPIDALISTGFVLVVAGAIAQRRPTRG